MKRAATLSKAKLEAETGGKLELRFAANAVLIRQHLVSGNPDAAKSFLESFEKVAKRDGLKRLLPTIAAMHCRIALMEGDSAAVESWLKTAPDENEAFIAMDRYLYLTKIRCYIAHNELEKAFSLIESTRFYAEKCDRKIIAMELSILTAIVMFRRGSAWQESFLKALEKIYEYRFVPIISREGAAVFPLFEECRELCCADKKIKRYLTLSERWRGVIRSTSNQPKQPLSISRRWTRVFSRVLRKGCRCRKPPSVSTSTLKRCARASRSFIAGLAPRTKPRLF